MTVERRAAKVPLMQRAPGAHGPGLFLKGTTYPHATTHPIPASTDVRAHGDLVMVLSRSSSNRSVAAAVEAAGDCEAWPYLEQDVLRPSRSRKVCMTCHWFRHHAGPQCIPLLTCELHQGLIGQGDHLLNRCQGWTDDMTRQRGWAPEVS